MQRLLLLCLGAAAALRSEPHSSATSGSIPDGVLGAAAKSLFDLVNGVKQEWKQRKAEKARGSSPVVSPEPSPPLPLHEAVGESTWVAVFGKSFLNCWVFFCFRSYLGDNCRMLCEDDGDLLVSLEGGATSW